MTRAYGSSSQQSSAQEAVRQFIGSDKPVTLTPIPTGRFNTTFIVDTGADRLIIRIAPPDEAGGIFYEKNMMAQEPRIHKLVREKTSVPVPAILLYDDSCSIIDRNYLIMDYVDAEPLSSAYVDRAAAADIYRTVGQWLGEVHEKITADKYGYLGEHGPMAPQPDWNSAFKVMWDKMADQINSLGDYSDSECDDMKNLLNDHEKHFNRKTKSSLLHMDVWAQNILVDKQGRAAALIDWDRALWGDPEIEFAVLDYCGVSEPPFWQGYGRERDLSASARIRNLFYLLYEVQKYIVICRTRRLDPTGARSYKAQVMRLVSGFG